MRRCLTWTAVSGIMLSILCASNAMEVWQGSTAAGWQGCVVEVNIQTGTGMNLTGVVDFGADLSPKLELDENTPRPSLVGSMHVGLEFGGAEKAAGADCQALVADQGAVVTGVRLLSERSAGGLQPLPLHVTPDPASIRVYTSLAKNFGKVYVYNATLFLEDSGPASLKPAGDNVFMGPVTARLVSATGELVSSVLSTMTASIPPGEDERLQVTDNQTVSVQRVFSAEGVELQLGMPNVTFHVTAPFSDVYGFDVTLTGTLSASSSDACPAPLKRSLADGTCSCPEGFSGAACSICTGSAGCGDMEACDTSFLYTDSTSSKGFTCKPAPDSPLTNVLTVLELQCSPSGPVPAELAEVADDVDQSAGFCEMQVGLNIGIPLTLQCHAYNCEMASGSTAATCSAAVCSCPGGCSGLDAIANSIQSASMQCNGTGACRLEIAGLPPGFDTLDVLCSTGECLDAALVPGADIVPYEQAPAPIPADLIGDEPPMDVTGAVSTAADFCDNRQIWDEASQTCLCSAGLSGATCGVCSSDASCGAPGVTCDTSFNFTSTTGTKAFICTSSDPTISQVVNQVDIQCTTDGDVPPILAGAADEILSSSFCDVQVRVALGPNPVDITCAAYNCAIPLDQSSTSCSGILCDCKGGDCATFNGLVSGINSVTMGCADSGECSIEIGGLPFSNLAVQCTAGECIDPASSGNFTGTQAPAEEPDWQRIAIAVVGFLPSAIMVVLLLLVFLLARASQTCIRTARDQGAHTSSLASTKIKTLSFEGLTVTVPQAKQRASGKPPKTQDGDSLSQNVADSEPVAEAVHSVETSGVTDSSEIEMESMEAQPVGEAVEANNRNPGNASDGNLLPYGAQQVSDSPALDVSEINITDASVVNILPTDDEDHPEGKRCILSNVSCTAVQGEVMAIMGPSGSGKTTLLSILAAREGDLGRGARVKGAVLVDGNKRKQRSFRSACAYVAQDDALFPSLTVRESVFYSAKLRMPDCPLAKLDRLTDQTLSELRLSHVARVRVGSSAAGSGGRGVSGGERRRVSIAMEMVTQPSIIMLDEPTSGLDSFAAGSLMSSLKDIAAGGRVVVQTLHQPSPTAFFQLDRVLLLARGRRVFSGSPAEVEEFFNAPHFPSERGMPVADHMLQVVSDPATLALALDMAKQANDSGNVLPPAKRENGDVQISNIDATCETEMNAKQQSNRPSFSGRIAKMFLELDVLLWRGFTNLYRTPTLFVMHSAVALCMGIGMGVVYLGVDNSLSGLQNKAGGIFFALAFFAFCSLTTVDTFLTERTTVLREIQGGYYSAASYLVVKIMLDSLLLRVIPAVLFSFPFYYLMGLSMEPPRVAVWFAVLSTFSATAGALSLAGSVACPTAGTANLVMTMILLVSLVFGGFLANLEDMPVWVSWISWFSIFRYSFEALVVNEIVGTSFDLTLSGYDVEGLDSELLLETLGLNKDRFSLDVIVLDCMFIGFIAIAVMNLYLILPRHGRRKNPFSRAEFLQSGALHLWSILVDQVIQVMF